MPVLDVRGIGRIYGARTVLDSVSFTLTAGDRVGLVGANGSGKTTLGRILAGWEEPDRGTVVRRRGARVGYLAQEPRFDGDPSALDAVLSGLEAWAEAMRRWDEANLALERGGGDVDAWLTQQEEATQVIERLGGWDRTHDAESMLTRLGIRDHAQLVSTMSGGERRRVDLARLLVSRPDLAILDEPTNHLDVDTIEWLEAHLRDDQPGALLLITHDRYFLDRAVKRTAELSHGVVRIFDGGYEAYLVQKAEREAQDARAEKNRQNLLRRELAWLRRSAPARTTKQKARTQRAQDTLSEDGPARAREIALTVESVRSGRTIVDLDDVTVQIGDRTLVTGLTLALTAGERVGIVGANGTGKTTLLRTILGEHPPASGTVTLGKNTRITYFGQNREGLDERATVLENIVGGSGRVTVGQSTMDARAYLERFFFDGEQARQPVGTLSGGEKARVLLAKLLLVPTNLLVLDEPTNDLDVETLAALEDLLVEISGTALVVTHDRWFLDRVATAILAFEGDGEVVRYPGGYSSYRELKALRAEDASRANRASNRPPSRAASVSPPPPADKARDRSKKTGLTYGERLELEKIVGQIATAESSVAALEAELSDPSVYEEGGERAASLVTRLEAAQGKLETMMSRWELLENKKSAD